MSKPPGDGSAAIETRFLGFHDVSTGMDQVTHGIVAEGDRLQFVFLQPSMPNRDMPFQVLKGSC